MFRHKAFVPAMLMLALLLAHPARAQHYQTDFPPEEFRARWQKLFEGIGENAVAVLQGMPQTDGYIFPRQYNNFYYLSGIETPGSYLLLDGRSKRVTLFLPPRNEALERAELTERRATFTFPAERDPIAVVLDPGTWLLLDAGPFTRATDPEALP